MRTNRVIKPVMRYSEAFKMQLVAEIEQGGLAVLTVKKKYGVRGGGTVEAWVRKYGNGTRGKIIRVETPEEIDQMKRLKERVKLLESLLADANIDLALERGYTQIACERAGIKDVGEFKKNILGGSARSSGGRGASHGSER